MSRGNFADLKNRISYILTDIGLSQAEFAKTLRISDAYISELKSGESTRISPHLGELISIKFGYNYDWVMEGKGDIKSGKPQTAKEFSEENLIPVSIYTFAGAGDPIDIEGLQPMEVINLPKDIVGDCTTGFKIRGDSMVRTISHGDYVGIDFNDKEIKSDDIYCLRVQYEGIVIKRLYMLESGQVLIKGDNPNFPETKLPADVVEHGLIIGKVKWWVHGAK
jgi:transcriptional regulator with XRE-family HTH domain